MSSISLDDLDETTLGYTENAVRVPTRQVDEEDVSVASEELHAPILSFPPLPPLGPLDDRPKFVHYPLLERPVRNEHDAMAEAQALFEWALRTVEHSEAPISVAQDVTYVVENELQQDGVEVERRLRDTGREGGGHLEHNTCKGKEMRRTNRKCPWNLMRILT
ncbi:hypothetical protein M427DRAFT_355471 [Gonapodya prolifera JEL478]|uniref:Uncharacterized protein n=1 Tax=Gonapodya prolifera (strain JEL478) TaxID=1344416 RepID=A0A139ACP3_GONPJ|nr:hypothetical protein M427DRAFT_355471 [Gonapodya prolifera JEL478]|eukprot:KXS14183.1 hypothetical protein M427DRAFT_355471 [Gonapodya prolifera JEL478]